MRRDVGRRLQARKPGRAQRARRGRRSRHRYRAATVTCPLIVGASWGRHYNPPRCERRRLRLRRAADRPSRVLRRPVREHADDRRAGRGRRPLRAGDLVGAVDGAVDDVDRDRHARPSPRVPPLGRDPRPVGRDDLPRLLRVTATRSEASSSTRTTSSRTCPRRTFSARRRPSTARSSSCARTGRGRSSCTSTTGRRTCRTTSSTRTARTGWPRSRR